MPASSGQLPSWDAQIPEAGRHKLTQRARGVPSAVLETSTVGDLSQDTKAQLAQGRATRHRHANILLAAILILRLAPILGVMCGLSGLFSVEGGVAVGAGAGGFSFGLGKLYLAVMQQEAPG